jgi:hypothetical protein
MPNCTGCPQSMLCQLDYIANMLPEKDLAEAALSTHRHLGAVFYCMRVAPCLYGQANVKWDPEADRNFKFCGPLDQILAQRLLNTIIHDKKIQAIITDDLSLFTVLQKHFVPQAYARLLHLITPACGPRCTVEGLTAPSIWKRLWSGP